MACYIGIDCGTQGTKVVVYDSESKSFLGDGYRAHEMYANKFGAREQEPSWWITALDGAMSDALKNISTADRKKIAGISVSGQQHGLVVLGADKKPLCRAKLWNDTETASANERYITAAGGSTQVIRKIGTAIPVGYTVSKLRWLKENNPELFNTITHVMNPKDYINYHLTGIIATDAGSASGTGYFNVIDRTWSDTMLSLIAQNFKKVLPPVIGDSDPVGTVTQEIAEKYDISKTCVVAAGSGDNMMAAVGTGNVTPGIASINLGTSGVISIFTDQRPKGYPDTIQIQNAIPNGWIPTVCTMNATSVTTAVQELLALPLDDFDAKMAAAPVGSEGIIMLPFFNGERIPSLPEAKGSICGLTMKNFTQANCIRAAAEAAVFGLRWGAGLLKGSGNSFDEMRLIGGGSNSAPWRQITADVFNVEIIGVKGKEAGAFGAVIQAMNVCGEGSVPALCGEHIVLDTSKKTSPIKENVAHYEDIYAQYLDLRKQVYTI